MSSYPDVYIVNSTPYSAAGHISFAACSGNDYSVAGAPAGSTTQTGNFSRGVCLLTKITATVNGVDATPYESSGTSYGGAFIIVAFGTGFIVTRKVN